MSPPRSSLEVQVFKSQERRASTKILDSVIELSTVPGDLVIDPFGGSGTTFAVCEKKHRHWIETEIDFAKEIADRIESGEIRSHRNNDVVDDVVDDKVHSSTM